MVDDLLDLVGDLVERLQASSGTVRHDRPRPRPHISIQEALRSEEARRLRDRQLAHWCRLPADEVEPFLQRLRIYDARTEAWEIKRAREAAAREAAR